MKVPCKNIPTYDADTKEWSKTSFSNQAEFGEYLIENCFKEPGEYDFDESVSEWRKSARFFEENKLYTLHAPNSTDYWKFWDEEELRSRLGVLWRHNNKVWYLVRDYYFLLNYCPVTNKEKGYEETFVDIRDGQYHMMLYEKLAEIFHQNSVILKRRQFLFSFCHAAKSINYLYFENRKRIKWFASDDDFITGINGSWSIIDQYKTHLNKHTAWSKEFSPDVTGEIQQRWKITQSKGKWEWVGNESSIVAKTLKKDPKLGVGAPTFWAFYEEGGIAPTADITLQYMEPAITSGLHRVGSFCIGGSVGDLKECKPLRKFMENPSLYGFYKVSTRWWDETGITKECGLFIPAQYCMPEATDEFGNSQIEKALELLEIAEFKGFKKGEYGRINDEPAWVDLEPEEYILKKSQSPKNIKEAFAWRTESYYNVQRIERRQEGIKILERDGKIRPMIGLLEENNIGDIVLKDIDTFTIDKPHEIGYPVNPKEEDKRGVVRIYEKPDRTQTGLYYAGVDSLEAGITFTSHSCMSVHIYKRGYTTIDQTTGIKKTVRGKIVASWFGRYRSVEDGNDQALLLIRLYKAKAACERNKPNFINHARRLNYHHLIAKRSELPFDKDLDITGKTNDEYGIWMDSAGKLKNDLKRTLKEYLDAEVDTIHKKNEDGSMGEVIKVIRGYDLMDGYWDLEELKLYNEQDNFDRWVSLALAVAYGTAAELTYEKKVYTESKPIDPKYIQPKKQRSMLTDYTPRYNNKPNKPRRNLLNY